MEILTDAWHAVNEEEHSKNKQLIESSLTRRFEPRPLNTTTLIEQIAIDEKLSGPVDIKLAKPENLKLLSQVKQQLIWLPQSDDELPKSNYMLNFYKILDFEWPKQQCEYLRLCELWIRLRYLEEFKYMAHNYALPEWAKQIITIASDKLNEHCNYFLERNSQLAKAYKNIFSVPVIVEHLEVPDGAVRKFNIYYDDPSFNAYMSLVNTCKQKTMNYP